MQWSQALQSPEEEGTEGEALIHSQIPAPEGFLVRSQHPSNSCYFFGVMMGTQMVFETERNGRNREAK